MARVVHGIAHCTTCTADPLLPSPPLPLPVQRCIPAVQDLGSRDESMVRTVREIRSKLLALAHVSQEQGYECVLMQGELFSTTQHTTTSHSKARHSTAQHDTRPVLRTGDQNV